VPRGRYADHPEPAHALHPERIDHGVVLLDEHRLDLVDVGVDGPVAVLEVRVHDAPVAVIDLGRLLERHADAPDAAADFLAVRGLRVDDLAGGGDLDRARDTNGTQVRVHLHLDELRAVSQRRVLLALLRGPRLERLCDLGEAAAPHDVRNVDETRRIALEPQPALEHLDVGVRPRLSAPSRRFWTRRLRRSASSRMDSRRSRRTGRTSGAPAPAPRLLARGCAR